MRISTTPVTEVTVETLQDGGSYTITPAGTVTIAGSTFHVQRTSYLNGQGEGHNETHLIGARGSLYLLVPHGDTGIHRVIALNTGAAWRKRGNEVRVLELGGIIEEYKKN